VEESPVEESGTTATRDLRFNAERAEALVEAETAAVEDYLRDAGEIPDFVVADPPRTGLGKRVVARLLQLRPARVHLVSCDPATLARDLAQMTADGAYRVEELVLLDLFPQTFHMETLVKLVVGV
jgi:23S rRNA (uracil1939-C5)-methyltransferase